MVTKQGTDEARTVELEELLREHSVIADRIAALEDMKDKRRSRILLLMRELGRSKFAHKGSGTISFQVKRSFKVVDHERLAELFSAGQLAGLAKITADVYDAAMAEEIPLDEAVTVGKSETMTVSRPRGKKAKEFRSQVIEESKRQAEARILILREQFAKGA